MRLRIHHRTFYRYSEPVTDSYNEARLQPTSDARQTCEKFTLRIQPAAAVRRYLDLHRNQVDHFHIGDAHPSLDIIAESVVTTLPVVPAGGYHGFPKTRLGECLRMERCYDFLQRSEYVSLEVGVWRAAQDYTSGVEDVWDMALAIRDGIHRNFTYDTQATTVSTSMAEVLQVRRGVCQDFAHVMIGMCRSARIPARYVSGYLYVASGEDLRGNLASHAWVEIFLPHLGWIGLDPTNKCLADEHHVKVAIGRDYADAAPLCGNFRGQAAQELQVELSIDRLPDPEPAAVTAKA